MSDPRKLAQTNAGQARRLAAGGRRLVLVLDAEGAADLARLQAVMTEAYAARRMTRGPTMLEVVQYALREAVRRSV